MPEPASIPSLIDDLLREAGRPRLTWYGPEPERVELSGPVLANWAVKTTNLLVEEFDAGPGTVIGIDLPPGWRSMVWVLSTWRTGATAALIHAPSGRERRSLPVESLETLGSVRTLITDRPAEWVTLATSPASPRSPLPDLVAVALPALARGFGAELPRGALDAARAVMTYPDALGYAPPVDPDRTALIGSTPSEGISHRDLVEASVRLAAPTPGERRLVVTGRGRGAATARWALEALGVWAAGGSVVGLEAGTADALTADPDRLARLREGERVTSASTL